MATRNDQAESPADHPSEATADETAPFGKVSFADADDRASAMTDYIEDCIDDLADRTEEARASEALQKWLDAVSVFHDYSSGNIMLILAQKPDATLVAGFKTWLYEFDRSVKEGEDAIWIRAPLTGAKCPECGNAPSYHDRDHIECTNHEDGDPDQWDDGVVGFKPVHVFDVSQTEGEPLPEPEFDTHTEGDAEGLLPVIRAVAENRGYDFSVVDADEWDHDDALGVCKHTQPPAIEVKNRPNAADLCRTAVHEFAHAELHVEGQAPAEKSKREVEAEATAYAVARYLGLDPSNSAFTLAAWADDDADAIRDRLQRISATASGLIDSIETVVETDE